MTQVIIVLSVGEVATIGIFSRIRAIIYIYIYNGRRREMKSVNIEIFISADKKYKTKQNTCTYSAITTKYKTYLNLFPFKIT